MIKKSSGESYVKRLPVRAFQPTISKDNLSCVIFGSKNCPGCVELKNTIEKKIAHRFPKIQFYEFHCRALGGLEIAKSYKVNFMPRTIVFKKGKEVGRFLLTKTPEQLEILFNELEKTSKILPKSDDVEQVVAFRNRVFGTVKWNCAQKEKEALANKLVSAADDIIRRNPAWGELPQEDLGAMVQESVKRIDSGEAPLKKLQTIPAKTA